MVQMKMRPIFSRGNSIASFSVARLDASKEDEAVAEQPESHHRDPQEESALVSLHQVRQRRRRKQLVASGLRVSFAEPSVITAEHPPSGEPLTDKELRAYFYSADDLKRFDRDRAITAHLYRTGKGPDGGDGPWDDNVHSIRGLEDFLKASNYDHGQHAATSHQQASYLSPPSPSDAPRDALVRGAMSAIGGGRALAATAATTTSTSAAERERREHARLVLSEQDRLRSLLGLEASSSDSTSLSEVSSKSSYGPRKEALDRGREDAAAVSRFVDSDAATSSRLQAVRGRLYALMERPPSVRSLLALDRQSSFRSLMGGGGGIASSPGSGAATPLQQQSPPAAVRLLGSTDKQPSLRSLLARGIGGGSSSVEK